MAAVMAAVTTLTCVWCGRRFERPGRRGTIPKYCRPSCRQRAYEMRKLLAFVQSIKDGVA